MENQEGSLQDLKRELEFAREALRDLKAKHELLLRNFPQKLFVKDTNSNYVACNSGYARDLNISPEEIVGKNDFDFYPLELAEKYRNDDQRIMASGEPEELEEIYPRDGREMVVYTYKRPVKDEHGLVNGVLGVFWDISKFKQAENDARRNNKILGAVNDVLTKTLDCETEEELAKTCLQIAEDMTASRFGFIGELNSQGRYDTIALSDPGWDACQMNGGTATMLIKGMEVRGIWGKVIKTGRPLIVNDPSNHPDRVGVPTGHPPLTSFLGVPLKLGKQTFGMMALGNKEGGYDEVDREAAENLSMAIVQALRSKRAELERLRSADVIFKQNQEIMELSTPVVQAWEGIVIAPLIGTMDSQRTQQFMERFLGSIVDTNSSVALVDITGVPTVDTMTAQHLIEAITAAKLLGAQVILTGVRPSIAQTMVHLGIDLTGIETQSSLVAGIRLALDCLGLVISRKP